MGGPLVEFFYAILRELGRVLVNALTSPSFLFIYALLFVLVTIQYRRLQALSESNLQCNKNIYWLAALLSTLLGLLGGITGSIVLIILGVDLSGIAVGQLWLAAVLLMLIKPRFLCFAYAAGLLSAANLVFGYPDVNIPQLMGLVGVLHLVESMLIFVNGTFSPWPIYVNKGGSLRGGFNLQQFWPIPLAALVTVGVIEPNGSIMTPDWWPLLQGNTVFSNSHTYILVPLLAMLGYGEITTTKTPVQAVRKSSWHLLVFSIGLIMLSIVTSRYSIMLPLLALYSPLGHELVIWLGMRSENRAPLYVPPQQGVMVLDVLPGSPAFRSGLRSHDIILSVKGETVHSYRQVLDLVSAQGGIGLLEIARDGELLQRTVNLKGRQQLGLIPVPDDNHFSHMCVSDDEIFSAAARFWRLIKHKLFTL